MSPKSTTPKNKANLQATAEDNLPATKSDTPEVLELVLETKEVKYWEPYVTVEGHQIAEASDEDLKILRNGIKKRYDDEESDKPFSEIKEVQRILRGKPLKRDEKGKLVLHPQAQIPQMEDFSIEESRPRNRILWAIEEALRGRRPEDVKKIAIRFTFKSDLKQPKYSDAELLAKLVGWATERVRGLGDHWPDFREKFVPTEWPSKPEASRQGCLLTEAKRIISEIK